MENWKKFLNEKIQQLKNKGIYRKLKLKENNIIDFSSNDYLGIAKSFNEQANTDVISGGSTGSRLLTGNSATLEELELFLASFHKSEAGLLFNSGYLANLAVLSSVPQKGDLVIYDELCHSSIKDGLRLCFAERFPFKHNDLNDLEKKLSKINVKHKFVVVESVYSMDGDLCPLKDIVYLCSKYNAFLILDEAHSTGLFGYRGEGLSVELNLENYIHVRIHTFGKAIGSHGAIVVGDPDLKSYLINTARPFIYTTSMSENQAKHIFKCYQRLEHINLNLWTAKTLHFSNTFQITHTKSPIYPIIIGSIEKTILMADLIQKKGYDVRPILPPTVKKGSERLRITLHLFNTEEQIKGLYEVINYLNEHI
jgi:8-amino-7-oxononanoate synthase